MLGFEDFRSPSCLFRTPTAMALLHVLAIVVLCSLQAESTTNRCDELRQVNRLTMCTSCSVAPAFICPPGTRRTSEDGNCTYTVNIGSREVKLRGCMRSCETVTTVKRCCPGFFGPLCSPCPSWSGRVCNLHGNCVDGELGSGRCECEVGFTGAACERCSNANAYGEHCTSVCSCVNGQCNAGPDGDGACFCQPPYFGPRCDKVTHACLYCSSYSYCKGEGVRAQCECLPRFKKVGRICVGVCGANDCDPNADCSYKGEAQFECKCKTGFEGNGTVCHPINPCSTNNSGCPAHTSVCEYTGPGESKCVCPSGTEGSDPRTGCTPKYACKANTCHKSAQCKNGPDSVGRCFCRPDQISDGRRCYGNLMERIQELDQEGSQGGNLTGTISLFEKGCELTLNQHGPFTALIPVDTSQVPLITVNQLRRAKAICRQHLILGQRLYKDLEGKDFWTYGGETIRFKTNNIFILKRDPDTTFKIIERDVPASNGIIHIINKAITFATEPAADDQFSTQTIGDILATDSRFNRFISLLDNCGAPMPLRGAGPLTVFVPTNSAVDKARDGSIIYMLNEAKHKLQELLKHHMFSQAALSVDQISSMTELQTLANQVITINVADDGRVLLTEKGVTLQMKDIVASNGVIHIVDALLVPPSIVPILPHRCDAEVTTFTPTPCQKCTFRSPPQCPPGTQQKLPISLIRCGFPPELSWGDFENMQGCAVQCATTEKRAECCKGFYGPDCKPCIGGFTNPCYGKGNCSDGVAGDGSCKCAPGFTGIGCHICSDPNKHGENCDEDCRCIHGECDNRPGSLGKCRSNSCQFGFSGELCDRMIMQCGAENYEFCHLNAYCTPFENGNMCVCKDGYEGDGHSCTEVNQCLTASRGGCNVNAQCMYNGPGNVTCLCNEGWTGDGMLCVEINNCLQENRGGCHVDADCKSTGPGQNECVCKKGYMGDGLMCDIINPCLVDNGGCHALAVCSFKNKTRRCTCPRGYEGDGSSCYGNVLVEIDENADFSSFNRYLKRNQGVGADGNLTALVPWNAAFDNLTAAELQYWTDSYRIPHLLKAHFLDGVYSSDDLMNQTNQMVQTKSKTKWRITVLKEKLMIGDAAVLISDLRTSNGYIHIINKVLLPPLTDVPEPPPPLMEVLNKTPSFSLFRDAILLYNITESIPSREFTLFVAPNSAVTEFLTNSNATRLDESVVKYHVIPKEQLFPEHLTDKVFRSSLLGTAFQIMVHVNDNNETLVNDVPLDGNFTEVRNGVIIIVPRVLQIHKNHCSTEVVLKVPGKCVACSSSPRCINAKPLQSAFPVNMKSNCGFTVKMGRKRKWVPGCMMDCLRTTMAHACCPGYYGSDCFKCPGMVDNWCSNNGRCKDGLSGTGECLCNEGFHGTACEMCEPGRYGKDCKSVCHCEYGKCSDGVDGNGQCVCYKGWRGVNCSVAVVNDECGGICDANANCVLQGTKPVCICVAGYLGNGTSCQDVDLCAKNNGGCSEHATCTKISSGVRSCTCREDYTGDGTVCLELDPCLNKNGGCSKDKDCIKIGPNKATCACKVGFYARRNICLPIDLCLQDHGGCSINAKCTYTGPGERNCTCFYGYKGNGLVCSGSINRELLQIPAASWLRKNLLTLRVRDLYNKGRFTLFIPHANYVANYTLEWWEKTRRLQDLLRYHIVSCEELSESDLRSTPQVVAASGHVLKFSVRDGAVSINGAAKILTSDYECSNGVIHIIDRVLVPYDINKTTLLNDTLSITATAEAHGYNTFSKLLQKAKLVEFLKNRVLHPLTVFWPSDQAFSRLPEEQKKWLYSDDHLDKLQAVLKFHMIRDQRLFSSSLPGEKTVRTLHGSQLSFSCSSVLTGEILINGNDAKIIERNLEFVSGIAHGIDKVLEPPNVGAHCDNLTETEVKSYCGSCTSLPPCPYGSVTTNKTSICRKPSYRYKHYSIFEDFNMRSPYSRLMFGCNRVCRKVSWIPKCCKNHYGRDCQVCPGGLEAPCGEHGDCVDGMSGTGKCKCHTGFDGTACELCDTKHYGSNCTACKCSVNGKCDDGRDGDGSCFCKEGWTGALCEFKIGEKPVCSPQCDSNAVCQLGNQCACVPPYEGDGVICSAPDLCAAGNGGCHDQADCVQSGISVNCTCKAGYTGDGAACSPINRCVEEANGGCSDFANCIFTGPNERRCECLPEYVGNGVQCFEKVVPPVDRCLEDNGGCDAKADCKDLHFHTNTAGVFHLRSPAGKYVMNFSSAEDACRAEDATLATLSQLSDAQQLGMHLCSAGWIDGKRVGYPIRFPSPKCGDNMVGIVLYKDPVDLSSRYDAYCYRIKEVTCECRPGYIGNGEFCNGNLVSVFASYGNFSIFYSTLVKYAEASEDGRNLMDVMTTSSSNTTVFVPHNAGFSPNDTLTWRDLEYHVSNHSRHLYDELQHNAAIPSRLGYDLRVAIESDAAADANGSQPLKLVNRRVILAWDIPATNGLIHVIQGPLKAPPVIVTPPTPSAVHSKSGASAVTSILVLSVIGVAVAAAAYYYLKHKKDAFRFQYFKNEDEDGSTKNRQNPDIVSIPNPLYSGYRAFVEPFGEGEQCESPATDTEAKVTPNLMD